MHETRLNFEKLKPATTRTGARHSRVTKHKTRDVHDTRHAFKVRGFAPNRLVGCVRSTILQTST